MKKILLPLLFLISFQVLAQVSKSISFTYDAAGNQIKREFVVQKISNKVTSQVENFEEEIAEQNDTDEVLSFLKYYPNPVDSELRLTWAKVKNKRLREVQIFSATSSLLRTISVKNNTSEITVPFSNLPSAVYLVIATLEDGNKETFKIIKR